MLAMPLKGRFKDGEIILLMLKKVEVCSYKNGAEYILLSSTHDYFDVLIPIVSCFVVLMPDGLVIDITAR